MSLAALQAERPAIAPALERIPELRPLVEQLAAIPELAPILRILFTPRNITRVLAGVAADAGGIQ